MKLAENNQYKEFLKPIGKVYTQAVKSSVSAVNVGVKFPLSTEDCNRYRQLKR